MAWKNEKWLRDIFPGPDRIYEEYRLLPDRELSIVAAAVLDSAIAELLFLRLRGPEIERHAFLGLDGDGRAPCGSFGARIQLAVLLDLITKDDATILRAIKNLRNRFAHEVNATFLSASVIPTVIALYDTFASMSRRLVEGGFMHGSFDERKELRDAIPNQPEAGAGLLLSVFTVYHAYFHRISERVTQIPSLLATKQDAEQDVHGNTH
jgi:hypothetical protein